MPRALAFVLVLLAAAEEPPAINRKIVDFARARVGQKVGDGQCSALATEAFRAAGAVRPGRSWGKELASAAEALPGDILQFEDAEFRGRKVARGVATRWRYVFPNHVAIVSTVKPRRSGAVLKVLHQNAGINEPDEAKRRIVSEWTLDMADLKSGTVRVFRPVGREEAQPGDGDPGP